MSYFVSYLLYLSSRHSNDAEAKHYARSTSPTNSGLPPVVILSIVGSAGTSLSELYPPEKCDLTLPSYLPTGRSSGKQQQQTTQTVFFLIIGSILLYFYLRRRRERARRGEHREKAWQFKDMQRSGQGPNLKPVGKSGATFQISYPVLMPEATSSPRIPTTALHW
jgi:hypothetical protein